MMCQCIHCKNEFHVQSAKSGSNAPLCPLCGKEIIAPTPPAGKKTLEMNVAHGIAFLAFPAALLPAAGIPLSIAGIILGGKKRSITGILLNIFTLLLALANGIYGICLSRITS